MPLCKRTPTLICTSKTSAEVLLRRGFIELLTGLIEIIFYDLIKMALANFYPALYANFKGRVKTKNIRKLGLSRHGQTA
ncbi:MAG: hypothetical protein ABIJ84_00200 [bacterium]